jgi:Site-specific recombinase XerD
VTADTLRTYVRSRQEIGRSNATINRELAGLKTAMKLGGLLWPNFPALKETGLRQGTYTREEVERLAGALPKHLVPVLWFAYHTGRRRGEILQIKWEDVNWEQRWITIRASTTKGGQPDCLPLTGALMELLMKLHIVREGTGERPKSPYIFLYRGMPFQEFSKSWKKSLQACGLPDKLFHDLRRTAATDLIEAGVSEQVAMAVTGHKTRSVFQRYHIVRQDAVREGLTVLQKHREKH